jgi:hypothetical protein
MRSLAFTAVLGSFIGCASVAGQSLTEHAAAAAGATIGTAAGKPLGTALGRVFGEVDKTTSKAAGPKIAKPEPAKPVAVAPAAAPSAATGHPTGTAGGSGSGGGDVAASGGGGSAKSGSSHHASRSKELPVEPAPFAAVNIAPIIAEPVIKKEPTVEEVSSIKMGATASELTAALGAPESKVSIPGDDGHLMEICQYWAKGEPVGTIRLDNGRVVSVQANN